MNKVRVSKLVSGITLVGLLVATSQLAAQQGGTSPWSWNQYTDAVSGGLRTYPRWVTDATEANKCVLEKGVGTLSLPGGTGRPGFPAPAQYTCNVIKFNVYLEGSVPGTFPTTPSHTYYGTMGSMTQDSSYNHYKDVTFTDTGSPKYKIVKYTKVKLQVVADIISPGGTMPSEVYSVIVPSLAP